MNDVLVRATVITDTLRVKWAEVEEFRTINWQVEGLHVAQYLQTTKFSDYASKMVDTSPSRECKKSRVLLMLQ